MQAILEALRSGHAVAALGLVRAGVDRMDHGEAVDLLLLELSALRDHDAFHGSSAEVAAFRAIPKLLATIAGCDPDLQWGAVQRFAELAGQGSSQVECSMLYTFVVAHPSHPCAALGYLARLEEVEHDADLGFRDVVGRIEPAPLRARVLIAWARLEGRTLPDSEASAAATTKRIIDQVSRARAADPSLDCAALATIWQGRFDPEQAEDPLHNERPFYYDALARAFA